ncbi:SOS response-associated peptidase [Alkanindiges illinoisensis]|uniref:SOS response-associated peptidase n=1 Tax=Alkanindiges illinoisensis TaxID=197183 RepID=UPI00047D6351
MCANFKPLRPELSPILDLFPPTFDYKSEVYPGYNSPILVKHKNHMEWREAIFGLIPKWAEDSKISRHTYNARLETVAEKPSFRQAWRNHQFALVAVESIYEPRYLNNKPERWAIERNDDQPFTVAALYELAQQHDELVRSMTMLTVNADQHSLMKHFHAPEDEKRSIVVIPAHLRMEWLTADQQTAREMLKELGATSSFHPDDFKAYAAPR